MNRSVMAVVAACVIVHGVVCEGLRAAVPVIWDGSAGISATYHAPTGFSRWEESNWTKDGKDGSAMTGHHDRAGPIEASWAKSWNSAHPTIGCDPKSIQATGGDGLFYCFAEK